MAATSHDRSLSLEQLEGRVWPDPGPSTRLVRECHRLRTVPLGQLTLENLRILLGQQIGVDHLMPLALEQVERDAWCEGDHYPGDLLVAVLRVDPAFWIANPELRARLDAVILGLEQDLQHQRETFESQILPAWQSIYGTQN